MLVPVAMNKVGMKTNADVNVKNYLRKECVIKDVFGMLVIVSVIIDKFVEECSENINGNELLYNETLNAIPLNVYKKVCNSCVLYIVLFVVFLIASICTCCVFIYFHWYLKK